MLTHRELELDDYLGMLRRRKWLVVIPAIVVTVVVYLCSLTIRDRYTSQTLVLVEQQKVPDSFVKSVVSEDLVERLATIQEQIFSRTRLQPIIDRVGLYKDENISPEEKVERVRESILITPVRSEMVARTNGLPGFYISFTASNARLAQQVCGELTSMFMSENLRAREQSAQGTTEFLRGQLEDAKRKLDEQDGKLADFQRKYIGQLPGQEQANLSMLGTLNAQLNATTQSLSRLQQDRAYTESLLNQQIAAQRSLQGGQPQTLEQQLAAQQALLVTQQARYTPDHPDIIKLKQDIRSLQEKLAEKPGKNEGTAPPVAETVEVQKLRAQIQALDLAIQDKVREQASLQKQIRSYEARVELSPMVQEQFKALTRDYQSALLFYNELLTKKNASEMATDLERRQQGEQFRVMDPPNLPEKPTFPNRPLFAAGGLGLGLLLGMGLVVLVEVRDKALRTEHDIDLFLELPTLVSLPSVDDGGSRRTRVWRKPSNGLGRRAPKAPAHADHGVRE